MDLFNFILIFALGFAFHCPAMCGPVVAVLYPEPRKAWRFHAGRFIGYSTLGIFAGKLGGLIYGAGWAALGIFAVIAISGLLIVRSTKDWLSNHALKRLIPQPILLGCLFTFIPCHYLWTMVGIAALSGSPLLGGLLMSAHAIMSALGIQAFQRAPFYLRLKARFQNTDRWLMVLSVGTLVYRIASQSELGATVSHASTKLLMCW